MGSTTNITNTTITAPAPANTTSNGVAILNDRLMESYSLLPWASLSLYMLLTF